MGTVHEQALIEKGNPNVFQKMLEDGTIQVIGPYEEGFKKTVLQGQGGSLDFKAFQNDVRNHLSRFDFGNQPSKRDQSKP